MTKLEEKLKGHIGLERVLITLWEMRKEISSRKPKDFDEQVDNNTKVSALDMAYIEVKKNMDGEQIEFNFGENE